MNFIKGLLKEFVQECAHTHPGCLICSDDMLTDGFTQGAYRMRDELMRWRDPSDVDSLKRDKECLLRFRSLLRGDGTIYALGYFSTTGGWFVKSDMVYSTSLFVDEYLCDLNKVSGIADAVFEGWRPIL